MAQGAYSKIPYFAGEKCCNLYCIEELCYYVYHNAYLLDDSFVTIELAKWVTDELELKDVGREISHIVGRSEALGKLICILSNNVGYYSEEKWSELLTSVSSNEAISVEERRKRRADSFLLSGRHALAKDEYETLLGLIGPEDVKLRAKVYHNLGVCYAQMFMFERAAHYFELANETYANTESYISMLSAMKMYMSQERYLTYLGNHKESYEDSLNVERNLEMIKNTWEASPAKKYLGEITAMKDKGGLYYDGIDSMTDEIKEVYREGMLRNRPV